MINPERFHLGAMICISLLFLSMKCAQRKEEPKAVPISNEVRFAQLEYFELKELTTNAKSYTLHQAGQGKSLEPCRISKTLMNSGSQTMLCWLEAEELDLYFHGLEFKIEVPSGVCDYVSYHPFYFWGWRPGTTSTTYNTYTIDPSCTGRCDDGFGGATACPSAVTPPTFQYNYSDYGGPNCDDGTITNIPVSYSTSGATTCVAQVGVEAEQSSGGKWQDCLDGPGKDFLLNANGWPIGRIYYAYDGMETTWKLKAPIEMSHYTNRYLANYTSYCASDNFNYNIGSVLNYATSTGSVTEYVVDPLKFGIQPFYIWTCYNKAREVNGRIYLQVRDWNTKFTTSDNLDQTVPAKMDDATNESGYNGVKNDFRDWDDTMAQTPDCVNNPHSTGFHFPNRPAGSGTGLTDSL